MSKIESGRRRRNDSGTRAGETHVAGAGQEEHTSGEDVVFEIEETVAIRVPIGRVFVREG